MKKVSIVTMMVLLAIMLTMALSSCKKNNTDTPASANPSTTPTNTTTGTTSSYYFQATIDGKTVSFQDGTASYGCSADGSSGTVTGGWLEVQSGLLESFATLPPSEKNSAGFSIIQTFAGTSAPTGTQIESMFGVKSYSYGKVTAGGGVDGAKVYYIDGDGVRWASDLGSADQTGSTFSITEHIASAGGNNIHHVSKAVFSCKLYNASGTSKTLTNGMCRSYTVLY